MIEMITQSDVVLDPNYAVGSKGGNREISWRRVKLNRKRDSGRIWPHQNEKGESTREQVKLVKEGTGKRTVSETYKGESKS